MLSLLLASGLSLGLGADRSTGLGEEAHALRGSIRYQHQLGEIEGRGTTSAKRESGEGWTSALDADAYAGSWGIIGLGWHHRDGGPWTKDRAELRAGVRGSRWRLTLGSLLSSRDRETSLRFRSIFPAGRFALECGAALILYDQGALRANRQIGSLVSVLLRYGL